MIYMASFRKRGSKYQARVNYYDTLTQKRKPITKTFNTKAEAKRWAAKVESDRGSINIQKYIEKIKFQIVLIKMNYL